MPQVNLHYTDWVSENVNKLEHDCLRVVPYLINSPFYEFLFFLIKMISKNVRVRAYHLGKHYLKTSTSSVKFSIRHCFDVS